MKTLMRTGTLLLLLFAHSFPGLCAEAKSATDSSVILQKTAIRFGTNALFKPIVDTMIPLMEARGYRVEIKIFDDLISTDVATEEGSIDVNLIQHLTYLNTFNATRNAHLMMLKPYLLIPVIGLFSKKYSGVDMLPQGATIALAMDLSNRDRSLRMLRDNGLLTLAPTAGAGAYTALDIVENPKKFQFLELDLYQLLRSLDDVDAAVLSPTYFIAAGREPTGGLCFSKDDDQFPCGVVVREENKDAQWVKDIMETITSDKCRQVIIDHYKGTFKVIF